VRLLDGYNAITETDFTYTNQRSYMADTGFGLMDYHARFYSPYLNQFIQPDTVIPDLTNSQAWNRYTYVSNNPVKYIDPSGHLYSYTTSVRLTDGGGAKFISPYTGIDVKGASDTLENVLEQGTNNESTPIEKIDKGLKFLVNWTDTVDEYITSFSVFDFDLDPYNAYDPLQPQWDVSPVAEKFMIAVGTLLDALSWFQTNPEDMVATSEYRQTQNSEYQTMMPTIVPYDQITKTPTLTQTPTSTTTPLPTLPAYYNWTLTPTMTPVSTPTIPWGRTPTP